LLLDLETKFNAKSDYKVWIPLKTFSSWEILSLKLTPPISILVKKELDLPKPKFSEYDNIYNF